MKTLRTKISEDFRHFVIGTKTSPLMSIAFFVAWLAVSFLYFSIYTSTPHLAMKLLQVFLFFVVTSALTMTMVNMGKHQERHQQFMAELDAEMEYLRNFDFDNIYPHREEDIPSEDF